VLATAEPLAPSAVSVPPDDLSILGNVYRLQFSYQPSGDAIREPAHAFQVLLVYPVTPNAATSSHDLAWTADGLTWVTKLRGTSLPTTQQSFGRVEGAGYVAILGAQSALPAPPADSRSGGVLKVVVLVLAGAAVLVTIGWYVRGSRRDAAVLAEHDRALEDDEPD
jgi:hypothetical protein